MLLLKMPDLLVSTRGAIFCLVMPHVVRTAACSHDLSDHFLTISKEILRDFIELGGDCFKIYI